jgi:hypothetical protein
VKDHSVPPHPGPFRIPKESGEFAAIIVAAGFITLGVVGLPIAKYFLLGAILAGTLVALLFHFLRKKPLFPSRFF